jgi:hypothetical protein
MSFLLFVSIGESPLRTKASLGRLAEDGKYLIGMRSEMLLIMISVGAMETSATITKNKKGTQTSALASINQQEGL